MEQKHRSEFSENELWDLTALTNLHSDESYRELRLYASDDRL